MLVLGCVRRRSSEAELGFAEGVFLCGLAFLAVSTRRWRRRRREIRFPDLFLAPVLLCSSFIGEVVEFCFGACGR